MKLINMSKKSMIGAIIVAAVFVITVLYVIFYIGKKSETRMETTKIKVEDDSRYISAIAEDVDVKEDIVYATAKNYKGEMEELKMDIYSPAGDTSENRATIMFIHGGGFTGGDKSNNSITKSMAIEYAKMGYVTVSVNYRLASKASEVAIKDAVEDIENAVQWLQENSTAYGIDQTHIALAGYSAGAVIAQHLCYSNKALDATEQSSITCVIDIAGTKLYYGTPTDGNPSCLIIHGTKDTTDAFSDSENFSKELAQKNIDVVLYSLEGLNHDLTSRYDEVRNQMTMFLYKELTGKDVTVTTVTENSPEYENVQHRLEKGPIYHAKQVSFQLDGKLDEWDNAEQIQMNQLKDAGSSLPSAEDFNGTVMVGWNEQNPTNIYIAATIVDDTIQDQNSADGKWYNDDCLEIAFDLSADFVTEQLTKWVVGTNGDLSALATKENTQVCKTTDGNTAVYEISIDLSKIDDSVLKTDTKFEISPEMTIGFSIAYDDAENNVREHQIGWTPGKFSDRSTFGNLCFIK